MDKKVLLVVGLFVAAGVRAEELVLNDLKAQHAVQLTGSELKEALSGAKVTTKGKIGSTRTWKNNADGKFIAYTDAKGATNCAFATGCATSDKGTWHTEENDTYCVNIEWGRGKNPETWCRYVFKLGDKYYTVKSIANGTAKAWELGLSK